MKYKAYLSVKFEEESEAVVNKIPVAMMQVDGGTSRIIDFSSTDDISLISELEQARTLNNIILYLAATRGNADARAVYELTNLNKEHFLVEMILVIERFLSGKLLEGVAIYSGFCIVTNPPVPALKNTFVTRLAISQTQLLRGKIVNHEMPRVNEF